MLRKRIRDVRVTRLRAQFAAARGHDHELPAAHRKRAGGGVAGRGEARFPEQPARPFVERAKLRVVRRRDEHKSAARREVDRKSTRLNSSHGYISYAVFCLKKKKK